MSFLNCVIIMILTIASVSTTDDNTATYRRPLTIFVEQKDVRQQVTTLQEIGAVLYRSGTFGDCRIQIWNNLSGSGF
jgi:hypothetical protein